MHAIWKRTFRHILFGWCTAALLWLAGCQSSPTIALPAPGLTPAQQEVLRDRGFVEVEQGWELPTSGKVLFPFGMAKVEAGARTRLIELGKALSEVGIRRLRVEGHTDARGSDAYNQKLSEERAEAVKSLLAEGGMAPDGIEVRGFGRTQPLLIGDDAENRRVAIIVPLR